MIIKRPYSKEASLFLRTNQLLGYGAGNGSGGYSVSFVDDKVILVDPRTGQVTVLTREQWNALPREERQRILRGNSRYQPSVAPEDEKGTPLNRVGGFIVMANTNFITDDNFEVTIGGEFVYSVDFTPNGVNAHFAGFGNVNVQAAKNAISGDVPLDSYVLEKTISRPRGGYPTEQSMIFMKNIKNNNSGNFGYIWVGFTKYGQAYYDQVEYSPDDGADYEAIMTWPQIIYS